MAKNAVERTAMVLRASGPSILREPYKKQSRLQKAPDDKHSGTHDPHKEGRALDIILLSTEDYECAFADMIVETFLDLRDDMQWSAVIYNREEWNGLGNKFPRIWSPSMKGDAYSYEHISHIHIEWSLNKADISGFWLGLDNALREKF